MTVVLDASAILAFVFDEQGADEVESALAVSVVPAIGWAEILQKVRQHGGDAELVASTLGQLGLVVEAADAIDARMAALLWQPGRGLSLADRFCLALGQLLDVPIWTCDRDWAGVDDRVVVIR